MSRFETRPLGGATLSRYASKTVPRSRPSAEDPREPARLRAAAEKALSEAAWDRAEEALQAWLALDAVGDVAILPLFRRLEEGRGTRASAIRRVAAFVDAHPTLAHDPYVRLERGLALRMGGERRAARDELLPARDALRARGDLHALSVAENCIGLTYLAPLDAKRARRAFLASRAHAEAAGLFDRIGSADTNLAMVELQSGHLDEAARAHRRALRAYERAGDARGEMLACHNLGNCLHDLGRDRAAHRYLARAQALARARKDLWILAWTEMVFAELARKALRLDDAGAHLDAAEATFTRVSGPTPTERAWLAVRRAEIALDRGDVRGALRLARVALADGVEQTPKLHARLLRARSRARATPTRALARELERIAADAEAATLAELAWRARTAAARTYAARAVDGSMDGADASRAAHAACTNLDLAAETLRRILTPMRGQDQRAYLRDRVRTDDAAFVLLARTFRAADTATVAATAKARAEVESVPLLARLVDVARASVPADAAARGLAALLDVSGADHAYLWIDEAVDAAAITAARDTHGRELPPRARPAEGRLVQTAGRAAGLLVLEGGDASELDTNGGPKADVVDAVAAVACALIEATRTRAFLLARAETQAEEARRLAVDLARAEAALGDARSRLEVHGDEPRVDGRGAMKGRSRPMRELFARLDRIRRADLTVLVTGESGTGKELVARAIHDESARASGPFVAVNCGALAETLLESELFGHLRGAFTGADRDAPGLFAVAHGGTLLLDEVGEMSLGMQAKLLRVLQEGEIRPVGSQRSRRVDVRVVAATHRDLEQRVTEGRFREDLYYRLHVLTVHVPPLRARGDDMLLLARHILAEGKPSVRLTPAASAWLVAQPWPGNVRELRAVLESARVLCDGDVIDVGMFTPLRGGGALARGSRRGRLASADVPERLDDLEAWAIERALAAHDGSYVRAAKALGIGRATLYRKLALYGIARPAT